MTNKELIPLNIRYTNKFKKDIKRYKKRYRRIRNDIERFIETITTDHFPGNKVPGTQRSGDVYKARIKNSDNNKGKSHGYRIIYVYIEPDTIYFLTIYSKSEQPDITGQEIDDILWEAGLDDSDNGTD